MGIDFKEKSFMKTDKKKFDENFETIFNEYERIDCDKCDLSSRQVKGIEKWICPHCNHMNNKEKGIS
jgi:hypothetical protein